MKKKVLLFAALFMMVITASITPSKASQAKSISRSRFKKLLKDKKHPYVTFTVKKGQVCAMKLLTE